MEIKRVSQSTPSTNNERYHHEKKKYEPQFQYLNKPSQKEGKIPSKEEVKQMVELINKFLKSQKTSVQYEFHENLNEYYVKVVDSDTNELVREIPPKKLLDLYAYTKEKIGLILDKKA